MKELLSNVGSGGGAPVAGGAAPAATGGGGGGAAPEAAKAAEKEPEKEEESDEDMVRLKSTILLGVIVDLCAAGLWSVRLNPPHLPSLISVPKNLFQRHAVK